MFSHKFGSGLHKYPSPLKVILMEEEVQASLMHHQRFGEGECFTNKASQALSERIVPAFHVGRFTCFLADSRMLLFWDHGLIRSPEIGEAVTCTVGKWNGLPQTATGGLAAISNGIRDHLTVLSAQSDPDPSLVRLVRNKGPELIQFQDRRIWIGAITVSLNGVSSGTFF